MVLKRLYESQRIENVCRIGLLVQKYSYKEIEQILQKSLDLNYRKLFEDAQPHASSHIPQHDNIRGNHYS